MYYRLNLILQLIEPILHMHPPGLIKHLTILIKPVKYRVHRRLQVNLFGHVVRPSRKINPQTILFSFCEAAIISCKELSVFETFVV